MTPPCVALFATLQESFTPIKAALENDKKDVVLQLLMAGASVTEAEKVRPPPINSL
jgi:hypothetical protein